jgi:hypothetical protein
MAFETCPDCIRLELGTGRAWKVVDWQAHQQREELEAERGDAS